MYEKKIHSLQCFFNISLDVIQVTFNMANNMVTSTKRTVFLMTIFIEELLVRWQGVNLHVNLAKLQLRYFTSELILISTNIFLKL